LPVAAADGNDELEIMLRQQIKSMLKDESD